MRSIQTTYYLGNTVKQINRAAHARSAVLRAVDHMQMNDYHAAVAEVFDLETGELHAVLTYSAAGQLAIVFRRDPKDPTCIVLEN